MLLNVLSQRRVLSAHLVPGILILALAAAPARAQFVTEFTKDDCNQWNNPCGTDNCDDVAPPTFIPIQVPRRALLNDRVQYVLRMLNDGTAETGLMLEDWLPPCAEIDCWLPCVDTDCDGDPDSDPVLVRFDGNGSSEPPVCDPLSNALFIPRINLDPDETMEVRFCARFTDGGDCCNDASIGDPTTGPIQWAVDALDPSRPTGLCVDIAGKPTFWKDDCGPRTRDWNTGGWDPDDCDDVTAVDTDGDTRPDWRRADPPPDGKRVRWVLHLENPTQSQWTEFEFDDQLGPEHVVCCQPGDCSDLAWGCFDVIVDGTPRAPAGTCMAGPGGGINTIELVPIGSTIEVRFCAELRGSQAEYCNNDAWVLYGSPPPQEQRAEDNLDGDQQVCIAIEGGQPCPAVVFDSDITVTPMGDCEMEASWQPATGGRGGVVYDLYRHTASPVPLDPAHLLGAGLTTATYMDTVAWGADYAYRVVARDHCTNPGPQEEPNSGGDSPLAGPLPIIFDSDLTVTPGDNCDLLVEWDPASSGQAQLVYDLYRDTGGPVPLDPAHLVAADITGTSHLDPVPWGPWSYRVAARDQCSDPGPQEEPNGGGDSDPENPIDETPPAFGGVTDTEDAGFCNVLVHWDESTAVDTCSGVALYTIYRDHGVAHRGETLVGTSEHTPYQDTTPGNGVWVYVVRAVDTAGNEEQNEVFVQESEGSCTNDFPMDAGMKKGKNIDPPNADKQGGILRVEREPEGPPPPRFDSEWLDIRISWEGSPDEGGLYPVTYAVLRGSLEDLQTDGCLYTLVDPAACGIVENEYIMEDQVDGFSYFYVIVPVSGDNATFGYDSRGAERPEAPVCE